MAGAKPSLYIAVIFAVFIASGANVLIFGSEDNDASTKWKAAEDSSRPMSHADRAKETVRRFLANLEGRPIAENNKQTKQCGYEVRSLKTRLI
jgi:hypothetical protein